MALEKRLNSLYAFLPDDDPEDEESLGFVRVKAVDKCPKTPDNSVPFIRKGNKETRDNKGLVSLLFLPVN